MGRSEHKKAVWQCGAQQSMKSAWSEKRFEGRASVNVGHCYACMKVWGLHRMHLAQRSVRFFALHWYRVRLDFCTSAGPNVLFCAGAEPIGFCVLAQCLDVTFVPVQYAHDRASWCWASAPTIAPVLLTVLWKWPEAQSTMFSSTCHWDGGHQMHLGDFNVIAAYHYALHVSTILLYLIFIILLFNFNIIYLILMLLFNFNSIIIIKLYYY